VVTVVGTSGAITSTTTVNVTVTSVGGNGTFALGNSGTISVNPGATSGNTSTITVTPSGGFTGTVSLSCAVTSSPSGAIDIPACGFASPSVMITGATAQTDVLTITTTAATAMNSPQKLFWPTAGGATLALLLFFVPRRRNWLAMLGLLVLFASGVAIGCGGGGGGNAGTTSGSYTVSVTGVSGGITQTTQVTVTVQ